ncbi:UPF0449 protein [Lates japonicus]|uniref:UPF0449 protein n=1 Tax=Lates japonicus TaxID=270547 RepID=A0AAD3N9S4_LATJO|nr:UPF0449 protein [Lates japonicus]
MLREHRNRRWRCAERKVFRKTTKHRCRRAAPNDPVFSILEQTGQDSSRASDSDVELKFQQCCRYLELNEQLQEARGRLLRQREELKAAGEQLDRDVAKVKGQPL